MEILYFGSLCDKEWFNEISGKKALPYQVAQYTFEMALINNSDKNAANLLQLIYQQLSSARYQAKSLVNTPSWREIRDAWRVNRKLMKYIYYGPYL